MNFAILQAVILWSPMFPWPLIAGVALLAGAGIVWTQGLHSRRRALVSGGLRIGALFLFVVMLLQPQRRFDEITILKPQLAVVIDTSESMNDPVDAAQTSRAGRAQEWLASPLLKKVRSDFELHFFGFDNHLAELPDEPKELGFQGGSSNLRLAVNQVQERFRGQPLAGILVLSDGLDNSPVTTVSKGAPVYTFELESVFSLKQKGKRVSLGNVDYPARVVVGWDSEIHASITGSGMGGSTVSVELWHDGRKEKEVAVSFNEDEQTRPVAFPVAPDKPGMMQYELRLEDAAADTDSKKYPFVIEAMAPGKRVLYVQNALGFDFKFLRKAIVTDRNLQLNAFVRWGDGRLVNMGERGVPSDAKLELTAAGLSNYSVVMLGDLAVDALTAADYEALKEFVNRGGGLVLLGGRNALASAAIAQTALADISPVKLPAEYVEASATVAITDAGLRHPVFGPLFASIKEFPPLLTANYSSGAAATAEVLMEASSEGRTTPLIALTRFGQGRVVSILTDTIWRWRLAAKSWDAERSPYDTFWTQLMDWLIPKEQEKGNSAKLELFTERANYLMGERPEVRAILRRVDEKEGQPPATLPLALTTPDQKVFQYTMRPALLPMANGKQVPGYRVEVEPNIPGVFTAASLLALPGGNAAGETRFVVAKPPAELTSKPIDRELLKRLAEESGGRFYTLEEAAQWPANIHFKQQQFARMQLADLWNQPLLLGLLFTLLAGDWLCRKSWNLP
ncbi:MAG: hypothetical protein JWL59_685 [Chthoniobacteraceae bacterium]|nr:hypothetical protein [Chthoniobacteraceae bacterium]